MSTLQKAITGLQIVAKYEQSGYDIAADHDIIYAGYDVADRMSEQDKQAMQEAGWRWDEGLGSFYLFV